MAYDGSEGSETALLEAAALAAEFEASVKLITAVPPIELYWSAEAFAGTIASGDTIREQRRNGFRHMVEDAAERLPVEARAATVLQDGRPATVIAEEAEKGIHLLVIGSRSYGPIRRVMVGSTAIELMRLAPCPCSSSLVVQLRRAPRPRRLARDDRVTQLSASVASPTSFSATAPPSTFETRLDDREGLAAFWRAFRSRPAAALLHRCAGPRPGCRLGGGRA